MVLRCEAPGCMAEAKRKCKFLDPRRGDDENLAYVVKFFCSETCQLNIVDELERVAQYARVVN